MSELLLPVGNYEMCLAAIHNGADAIYVGVPEFNARGRSKDHDLESLKEIIDTCHLYGVKVHLAFNIVIFEEELEKAKSLLLKLLPLGIDAFIVQDLGLAKLIRSMAPEQTIHGSTQMTITNDLAIKELEDLNIQRFVLGRENSLSEIEKIRKETDKELEVFVHGALCVAYSGQCFTSESLGGRSANRGQCAQSCRFEYELYIDEKKKDISHRPYIVSPQDLFGLKEVGKLQELGIESFKIEGRLKGPDYVAATASIYRNELRKRNQSLKEAKEILEKTFSRGFFNGWLNGVNHQRLVEGSYANHHGPEIGRVQRVERNEVLFKSSSQLKAGMGLLFKGPKKEIGGHIYEVTRRGVKLSKDFRINQIPKNARVFLNKDPQNEKTLAKTWKDKDQLKKVPVDLEVHLTSKELIVAFSDAKGVRAQIVLKENIEKSKGRDLDQKSLLEHFNKLSHSPYRIRKNHMQIEPGLFIHNKEIKRVKNELIEKLNQLRTTPKEIELKDVSLETSPAPAGQSKAKINILLRNSTQCEQFASEQKLIDYIDTLYLDFEFGKDYKESIATLKKSGYKVYVATTRIHKPGELHNLKHLSRLEADGYLVRNLGAYHFLKKQCPDKPIRGDFSFNITNHLTATYLFEKGFETLCPSYDLNKDQLVNLLNASMASKIEVTIHQYMPEFHMEHCVFASYLSKGTSFKDCGKPCEKHQVKLKDPYGKMHYLTADQECRNTFFSGSATSAISLLKELEQLGCENLRLEALYETGEEIFEKASIYIQFLNNEITLEEAISQLGTSEQYGLGSGQLNRKDVYQNRKKTN